MQGLVVEAWQCFASFLVNLSQTWKLGRLSQEAMLRIGKKGGSRRKKEEKRGIQRRPGVPFTCGREASGKTT